MTEFRFLWTRTWPEDRHRPHDFSVSADQLEHPHDHLRAYRVSGGPKEGQWIWGIGRFSRPPHGATGYATSRDEAALAAEEAYTS